MGSAAVAAVTNSRFRRAREVRRFIVQVRLGLFQPVKSDGICSVGPQVEPQEKDAALFAQRVGDW